MFAKLFPASVLLLVAMTGCSSHDTPAEQAAEAAGNCNAEAVQQALGQTIDVERVEQIRQQAGAAQVRVLAPDDMATMEHDPQRLTIHIDEAETIERLSCG